MLKEPRESPETAFKPVNAKPKTLVALHRVPLNPRLLFRDFYRTPEPLNPQPSTNSKPRKPVWGLPLGEALASARASAKTEEAEAEAAPVP